MSKKSVMKKQINTKEANSKENLHDITIRITSKYGKLTLNEKTAT